jgi:predicted ATPase
MRDVFVRGIKLTENQDSGTYPFSIPAVRSIESISFVSPITFFVGENGSGKSTITEALAVGCGFNAEGGTKNYNFSTENSTSSLSENITIIRGVKREKYGYFLRAESFYTTANYAESGTSSGGDKPTPLYFDGKRIHEQSHGEAFLAIIKGFRPGLFIFDEPESALSPQRLFHLMSAMHELERKGSQFIIATHSPILLAYPGANIYELSETGIDDVKYDEIEHVKLTKDFLNNPSVFIDKLFAD